MTLISIQSLRLTGNTAPLNHAHCPTVSQTMTCAVHTSDGTCVMFVVNYLSKGSTRDVLGTNDLVTFGTDQNGQDMAYAVVLKLAPSVSMHSSNCNECHARHRGSTAPLVLGSYQPLTVQGQDYSVLLVERIPMIAEQLFVKVHAV